MTMMVPMRRNRSMFNELMTDPFDAFFRTPAPLHKMPPLLMRTDIKESDEAFELDVDLPGFSKEDVHAEIKDGYLSISALMEHDEEENEGGTYVRKERFCGKCSRSFFVGDEILEDDVTAKFQDGVLTIVVPKKQEQPQLEAGHSITIEG